VDEGHGPDSGTRMPCRRAAHPQGLHGGGTQTSTFSLILGPDGGLANIRASRRDITERKEAGQSLAVRDREYHTLINHFS
jgi:hypothetical protein